METLKSKENLPWSGIWDWMPRVGGLAQMNAVILPKYGYCYMDTVRIMSIKGTEVVCVVEHQSDPKWWKNGTTYRCKLSDLWPNVYKMDSELTDPKQPLQLQLF